MSSSPPPSNSSIVEIAAAATPPPLPPAIAQQQQQHTPSYQSFAATEPTQQHQTPPRAVATTSGVLSCLMRLARESTVSGEHRVCINELWDAPAEALDPVLLQVVHTALTHSCDKTDECITALRRLLCHISASSFSAAMRIAWIIDSIAPILEKQGLSSAVEGLRDMVETAAVTKKVPGVRTVRNTPPSSSSGARIGSSPAPPLNASLSAPPPSHARSHSIDQQVPGSPVPAAAAASPLTVVPDPAAVALATARIDARSAIFSDLRAFCHQVTQISGQLRTVADRSKRKGELQQQLAMLSVMMPFRRVMWPIIPPKVATNAPTSGSPQTGARSIPQPPPTTTAYPKWIVRLVHERAAVFSSRERAPFLLLAEVISDPGCTFEDPIPSEDVSRRIAEVADSLSAAGGVLPASSSTSRKTSNGGSDNVVAADHPTSSSSFGSTTAGSSLTGGAVAEESLLHVVFGDTFAQRVARIRETSPFSHIPGWGVEAMVVKEGDDLRQEELALQLIAYIDRLWRSRGLTVTMKPYEAMATCFNGGLIEFIADSTSIDAMKKAAKVNSVHNFFSQAYGGEGSMAYRVAQRNFIESMAAYSVVSYLLSIKDRHNGNLMLSRTGHLIHIDFGFMFATSPGGMNFESAPFKLSRELVDVMGGVHSHEFNYFRLLVYLAFSSLREATSDVVALVALMVPRTTLPCFAGNGQRVVEGIKEKLALGDTPEDVARRVRSMIEESVDNWRTRGYDRFQTWQNGII